jgi:hypothetical protein
MYNNSLRTVSPFHSYIYIYLMVKYEKFRSFKYLSIP